MPNFQTKQNPAFPQKMAILGSHLQNRAQAIKGVEPKEAGRGQTTSNENQLKMKGFILNLFKNVKAKQNLSEVSP